MCTSRRLDTILLFAPRPPPPPPPPVVSAFVNVVGLLVLLQNELSLSLVEKVRRLSSPKPIQLILISFRLVHRRQSTTPLWFRSFSLVDHLPRWGTLMDSARLSRAPNAGTHCGRAERSQRNAADRAADRDAALRVRHRFRNCVISIDAVLL